MPAQGPSMRQVRESSASQARRRPQRTRIAAAIGISRYTVAEYLSRAAVVGITWPLPSELNDEALEAAVQPAVCGSGEPAAAAGLATAAWRTAPSRRHLAAAIGSVPHWATGRIRAQPGSAISTGNGEPASRRRCGKPMSPASDCSSITLARPCRSLIRSAAPVAEARRPITRGAACRPSDDQGRSGCRLSGNPAGGPGIR
jgi:hypothetical protein